jgi:hypothetical protein
VPRAPIIRRFFPRTVRGVWTTILVLAAFVFGTRHGVWVSGQQRPEFHDTVANHVADYRLLIDTHDRDIREEARRLGTPEGAYLFVRDAILFDPSLAAAPAGVTLRERRASCLGKAALLCSLYRAQGIPPDDVHVVVGEVATPRGTLAEHAWVELDRGGSHFQQDPTSLLGVFAFGQFPGREYTDAFIRKEGFCFNDTGFAVVSQLNRMRGNKGLMAPGR